MYILYTPVHYLHQFLRFQKTAEESLGLLSSQYLNSKEIYLQKMTPFTQGGICVPLGEGGAYFLPALTSIERKEGY